jgi:hypothetical protein
VDNDAWYILDQQRNYPTSMSRYTTLPLLPCTPSSEVVTDFPTLQPTASPPSLSSIVGAIVAMIVFVVLCVILPIALVFWTRCRRRARAAQNYIAPSSPSNPVPNPPLYASIPQLPPQFEIIELGNVQVGGNYHDQVPSSPPTVNTTTYALQMEMIDLKVQQMQEENEYVHTPTAPPIANAVVVDSEAAIIARQHEEHTV